MQKNEITEKEIKATPPKIQEDINLAAPGKLRVIKRNGKVVAFENEKIQLDHSLKNFLLNLEFILDQLCYFSLFIMLLLVQKLRLKNKELIQCYKTNNKPRISNKKLLR